MFPFFPCSIIFKIFVSALQESELIKRNLMTFADDWSTQTIRSLANNDSESALPADLWRSIFFSSLHLFVDLFVMLPNVLEILLELRSHENKKFWKKLTLSISEINQIIDPFGDGCKVIYDRWITAISLLKKFHVAHQHLQIKSFMIGIYGNIFRLIFHKSETNKDSNLQNW